MSKKPARRLIADLDTGIDDSFALLYLLGFPKLELSVVSTAGNVPAPQVAENNRRWLALAGRTDVEVALGAERPLHADLRTTEDTHGPAGVGYAELPPTEVPQLSTRSGVELWVETVRAHPGEVDALVTGPMTTLAQAIRFDPELPRLLGQLIVMGGAYNTAGNTTPVAEWNVAVDPEAATEVFQAFDGVANPPVLCGLGITERMRLRPKHLRRLRKRVGKKAAGSPILTALDDAARFYFEFHEAQGEGYLAHLHDPFAAAVALGRVDWGGRPATVDVELDGELTRAMTVVDYRGAWGRDPNALIVDDADPDEFFDELVDRIGRTVRAAAAANPEPADR